MLNQKRLLLLTFLSIIFLAATAPIFAQNDVREEASDAVMTKKGELKIIKVTEGDAISIRIELNRKIIKDGTDSPSLAGNFFGKYPPNSASIFLVSLTNDSAACAASFVIVDLSGKLPSVSREFGNCSDSPKAVYRGNTLSLAFPAGKTGDTVKVGKAATWQFKNGKLRRTK